MLPSSVPAEVPSRAGGYYTVTSRVPGRRFSMAGCLFDVAGSAQGRQQVRQQVERRLPGRRGRVDQPEVAAGHLDQAGVRARRPGPR